jgi:hypothetical protein
MSYKKCLWALAVVLTIGMGQSGCALHHTSRTSVVHDVRIDAALVPDNLLAQPNDEIRFVNLRKEEVQVEIANLKSQDLACERGFTNMMGALGEVVLLKANGSASLCFKNPVTVNYIVRMDTALSGDRKILNGVIKVEAPVKAETPVAK